MASLVLGGLGFIGASLVEELAGWSRDVCVVARRSSAERRKRLLDRVAEKGARILLYPELDKPSLRDALNKCGGSVEAYYLIGVLRNDRPAWKAHVEMAAIALEALSSGLESFVYVSAAPVVAECSSLERSSEGRVVEEEEHLENCSPPRLGFLASKYAGEKLVLEMLGEYGVKGGIARPVLVYGPHAYGHVEWLLLYRLARRGISLDLSIDVVYSRDVARALVHIARRARRQWYYVASPSRYTLGDLWSGVARAYSPRPRRAAGRVFLEALFSALYRIGAQSRVSLVGAFVEKRLSFYPARLLEEGFRGWETGSREAVEEFMAWLEREYGRE